MGRGFIGWYGLDREDVLESILRSRFSLGDMIFTGLEAKGVQRFDGSHYKNFN